MAIVRTRFAPSPTGFLHVGHLRTALFGYALAKKNNGTFVLRIEDTDRKRYVEGAVENIIKTMDIFGINFDEGPGIGGPYGPYIQSERLSIYQEKAQELVNNGYAYYCFLSEEELENLKKVSDQEKKAFRSPFRDASLEESRKRISNGEKFTIRLKVPFNRVLSIEDESMGKIEWNTDIVDDQILLKSDGFPTYHLGVVVDDVLMEITHITRGVEWLPSVPKHILLYEAFNYPLPQMAHMPVILDPTGGKLSKRKGAVSTEEFLKGGYLADALLNFIMLLGWSAPIERAHGEKEREIFSLKEFVELFDLKDLNKGNPVFNREKLLWFNQQYIKMKSPEELSSIFIRWLEKYAEDKSLLNEIKADTNLPAKLKLIQERAKTLVEVLDSLKFFYIAPEVVDWEIDQVRNFKDKISSIKDEIIALHEALPDDPSTWSNDSWAGNMKEISTKYGLKPGDAFMVLRLLVVGSPFSPPLFEAMQILGKEEVMRRVINL
jgi:glutamyl-tRNA synthetase